MKDRGLSQRALQDVASSVQREWCVLVCLSVY